MNKKLVASVLLAGLAAAYPVYAEDDRTPDEYNPEAKYVSPLAEPPRRAVNDRRAIQQSESDVVLGTATEGNNTDSGRIFSEQALPEEGEEKGDPLIITGEDAHYSSSTGDFIIQGNVRLVQGDMRICSTKAVGNAEKGDVWLLEGGTLQETSNTTHARWAHYNFNTKTGELRQIEGRGDRDFYKAPHAIRGEAPPAARRSNILLVWKSRQKPSRSFRTKGS